MKELGKVREKAALMDGASSWPKEAVWAPSGSQAPPPRGLYPACLRRSRMKMASMLSVSFRGLHAGRHLPTPPEELALDSLLVLSASQSWTGAEEELRAASAAGRSSGERTAGGREEEDEEDGGRIMLVIVSLKSLRRPAEDEEEEDEGLGRCRGACFSFKVSPGGQRRRKTCRGREERRRRTEDSSDEEPTARE